MPHPVDIHVGRKLKQIRTMRRLSQSDVARRLDLSFEQIQKYEIGSNRIAASRLFELSRILDVPTSYFFEGADEPETKNEAPNLSQQMDEPKTTYDDTDLKIATAIASIPDDTVKLRIITLIEEASGMSIGKK